MFKMEYEELCLMCKDYDDTWDITCFCPECQDKLLKSNGEIK